MNDHNIHISKYLDHYCFKIDKPEFAVLIKGDWGSGKTWFINDYINRKKVDEFLYISLYGLNDISEIDNQIFIKLHPLLGSKPVMIVGKILKSAAKLGFNFDLTEGAKIESNATLPVEKIFDLTKKLNEKIIVFDDLERSKIDPATLLGYINNFVEYQKLKVILVGHEGIIEQKSEEYRSTREKVIGQVFYITPCYDIAIKSFIKLVKDDKCRKFYENIEFKIIDLFLKLKYNNLRNLRQTLLSFEYFYLSIDDTYKEEIEYFEKLFIAFAYLSLEMKANEISKNMWEEAIEIYSYRGIGQKEFKALNEVNRKEILENARFGLIFNRYSLPLGKMLVDIVFDATINPEKINEAIKTSHYFTEKNKSTLGKLVAFWIRLTPDEFKYNYELLINELNDLKYCHPAELLHATSILLLSSEKNLIPMNKEQIYNLVLSIIDKLINESKLIKFDFGRGEFDNYGGYGFAKRETDEFKNIFNKLRDTFYKIKKEDLKNEIQNILKSFPENYYEFNRSLILYDVDGKYSHDPVLSFIDTNYFFSNYLQISNDLKPNFIHALKHRYELRYSNGELKEYLFEEEKFLIDLKYLIDEKIKSEEKLFNTDNVEFQNISAELSIILEWFKKHLADKSIQNIEQTKPD